MRDLFNPGFGMFSYDPETRLYWFRNATFLDAFEFELVGIMLGLAVFNSHLLEFQFPMVTYKCVVGGGAAGDARLV